MPFQIYLVYIIFIRIKEIPINMLKGIYKAYKKNGTIYYRSSITYMNKHISLGSFDDPVSAHNCYLFAKNIVEESNDLLSDYHFDFPLSFSKWVVLHNFRDNRLYFKTPIYLHKSYFSYHLSLTEELFFDIDDLFYYSTHRIHKRNGYYFVNDYGMQISILNRYHIKNHAVKGRDYVFIDHDDHNYRYDNINIINPYYGVIKEETSTYTSYKSVINVNGVYIIGHYNDIHMAAIAYNKAVDYLDSLVHYNKQFPKNYLVDIDSNAYKDIYKRITLNQKLSHIANKHQ